MGMGLILNVISPLLSSYWGFSFVLGCGISFFGGIQHSPVNDCSMKRHLFLGKKRVSRFLWENRLLEGTNKMLCAPGPRRKKQ